MNRSSFLKPIIFMLILTVVFTGSLATVNALSQEKIQFNEDAELRRKILYIFNIQEENADDEKIEEIFNENIIEKDIGGKKGFALIENGEEIAYALEIEGPALWGTAKGYLGISKDLSQIIGVDFTKHSETPGLGGRIDEELYKEQYRGIDLTEAKDGQYIINNPAPGGNIDAISGATQTSNSVANLINENLDVFLKNPEVK